MSTPGGPFLFSSASTRRSSGEAADWSLGLGVPLPGGLWEEGPHLACQVTCGAGKCEQRLEPAGCRRHNPEGRLVLWLPQSAKKVASLFGPQSLVTLQG